MQAKHVADAVHGLADMPLGGPQSTGSVLGFRTNLVHSTHTLLAPLRPPYRGDLHAHRCQINTPETRYQKNIYSLSSVSSFKGLRRSISARIRRLLRSATATLVNKTRACVCMYELLLSFSLWCQWSAFNTVSYPAIELEET